MYPYCDAVDNNVRAIMFVCPARFGARSRQEELNRVSHFATLPILFPGGDTGFPYSTANQPSDQKFTCVDAALVQILLIPVHFGTSQFDIAKGDEAGMVNI